MIYAIGDIHGELWKLSSLLGKIMPEVTAEDRIVFLGDYVDRGRDVSGVIELLLRLRSERPNTIFLRGNHEQMMLDAREVFELEKRGDDFENAANWFAWGGSETLASYPRVSKPGTTKWYSRIPDEHWSFIRETQMEFRDGGYIFVHAGLLPAGVPWETGDPRLWIRDPFLASLQDFGGTVVFGHTPFKSGNPLVMDNKIGIDTGATYGGPLTAVVLDPNAQYRPAELRFLQAT